MSLQKILLLLPLVGLISCASNPIGSASVGQKFEAGTIRLGGDLGYSSNGTGTMNGDAIHLDGNAGYFLTDLIEVGGQLNVEDVNVKSGTDVEAVYFALYGRAYGTNVGPYRTFAELGLGYNMGTISASTGPGEVDMTGTASLAVGLLQFMTDDIAVELALEETYYGLDGGGDGFGLALNLGVSWYL